jgi:hypothetical protein
MLKFIRDSSRGQGTKAPILSRPNPTLERRGGDKHRSLSAGAGVIAAAVVVVSFLTWLAPDSDRPMPLQVVDRVLPGFAEQIEEQAATVLEGSKETVQHTVRNLREGLAGAGSGIARIANASSKSVVSSPATLPRPSTAMPDPEEPSPSTGEASLPSMLEPSTPPAAAPPPTTSGPTTPPATEEPSPVPEGPPLSMEEPPSATEEPPPAVENPPPVAEESPPATGEASPPTTDEPAPPPTEGPPSTTNPPPPITSQPPPTPNEPPPPPATRDD